MSCAFGMSVLESTLSNDSATRWMHQLVKMKVTTTNSSFRCSVLRGSQVSEDFGGISFTSQFTHPTGLYKDTIGLYRVGPKMVGPSATLASWILPGVIAQEL